MIVWHAIWVRLSRSNDTNMDHSSRRHYSETISLQFRDQFRPWPISVRKLIESDRYRLVGQPDRLLFWCGISKGLSPSRVLRIG